MSVFMVVLRRFFLSYLHMFLLGLPLPEVLYGFFIVLRIARAPAQYVTDSSFVELGANQRGRAATEAVASEWADLRRGVWRETDARSALQFRVDGTAAHGIVDMWLGGEVVSVLCACGFCGERVVRHCSADVFAHRLLAEDSSRRQDFLLGSSALRHGSPVRLVHVAPGANLPVSLFQFPWHYQCGVAFVMRLWLSTVPRVIVFLFPPPCFPRAMRSLPKMSSVHATQSAFPPTSAATGA